MEQNNASLQIIVRAPTAEEKKQAESWQEWSKEASEFSWDYSFTETCLILEGEATVVPEIGDTVNIKAGDLVVFPVGLKCVWKITKDLRKKYDFS